MEKDELKAKEEEKPEESTEDKDKGSKSTTTPLIDIANAAAKRMEEANKETGRLMELQAERDARIALGGGTTSGQESPKEEKETDEEYAARFEKGEANPLKDDGAL
jgi:hypothetical protein